LHLPGVSVRLPAPSMVQMPSSVHCIPLPERPGALNKISTLPERPGQPRFGVAGVSPCCAHTGFAANTAPPAAAVVRKSLRFIVVMGLPSSALERSLSQHELTEDNQPRRHRDTEAQRNLYVSMSLCLCVSVSLCLCVSVSLCLCVSVSLWLILSVLSASSVSIARTHAFRDA